MGGATTGAIAMAMGVAIILARRPLTRLVMRNDMRTWGLVFGPGEPRTWFVLFVGAVLVIGGCYQAWRAWHG